MIFFNFGAKVVKSVQFLVISVQFLVFSDLHTFFCWKTGKSTRLCFVGKWYICEGCDFYRFCLFFIQKLLTKILFHPKYSTKEEKLNHDFRSKQ